MRGDHDHPPFEFIDETGKPDGFNVEIMRALAAEMNLDVEIRLGVWSVVRGELERGEIDALVGMYRSEERAKLIDFSIPHSISSYSVFVRDDSDITGLPDAMDGHVLALEGDLGHDYLLENGIGGDLTTFPAVSDMLRALSAGQGDWAILSHLQERHLAKRLGLDNIKPVGPILFQRKYCIAVPKGRADLLAEFNEGLSSLRTAGEFDRIHEKWFGRPEQEPPTFRHALRHLAVVLVPMLLLILAGVVRTLILQRRVIAKSVELEGELERRRTVELELRRNERHLAGTLAGLREAVITLNAAGRIVGLNPSAENMLGAGFADLDARPLEDCLRLVDGGTGEPIELPMERIIEEDEFLFTPDRTFLQKGRERLRIQARITSLRDGEGHLFGKVVVMRDVTKRWDMEAELHQIQKMDSIGKLAGGVAHDYSNTLQGIQGFAELLSREESLSPKQRLYVARILTTVRRAANLTRKLQIFSRRGELLTRPMSVDEVVNDAITLLKPGLARTIEVRSDLDAGDAVVLCDAAQIQNAILNLGVNARDAMPDGGRLDISTRRVILSDTSHFITGFRLPGGEYARIRVADTGEGMSPEEQARVFEPFFTTRGAGASSGLGLAAVYGTMQDHGGAVALTSEPNGGATFDLYLPLSRAEDKAGKMESSIEAGEGGCVLLVDDEEVIRELCVELLELQGYDAVTAEDGEAGVEQFKLHRERISLVILDVIMPRMNGIDCFRAIRRIDPKVPIIIASGYTESVKPEDLEDIDAFAFLRKPFSRDVLRKVLREVPQRAV